MIKKYLKITKRIIALFVILVLNMSSFAAVGGNDGSAFVTKAEFDALVNTFNEQMDNYESSLVTKIDGAIANYLAALSNEQVYVRSIALPDASASGVLSFNKKSPLDYVYGTPKIGGWYKRADFDEKGGSGRDYASIIVTTFPGGTATNIKKTTISNIKESTTAGQSTAKWEGYYDCIDNIICTGIERNTGYIAAKTWDNAYQGVERASIIKNRTLNGSGIGVFSFRACTGSYTQANSSVMFSAVITSVSHQWLTRYNQFISVVEPYDYDMFSNYDRDKNWGYDGTYMTKFDGCNNNITIDRGAHFSYPVIKNAIGNSTTVKLHGKKKCDGTEPTIIFAIDGADTIHDHAVNLSSGTQRLYVPMVGFERTYLTNWQQIYDGNTSSIADFEYEKHRTESDFSDRAILTDSEGTRYLGVQAGFPLIKVNKDERLEYNLAFADKSKNYVVWISDRPFKKTGHPNDDDRCISTITGIDPARNADKGYLVVSGEGTFKTQTFTEDCYLYIKWGINSSTKADIAGGTLMPESTGIIRIDE